uniref:NAD(P)(+)--arginine ADP-ribosyltransferase n=1 Tax=Arcella intermedia TaxID=1963864 RepID=A0A6B2KZM2_9EUKA
MGKKENQLNNLKESLRKKENQLRKQQEEITKKENTMKQQQEEVTKKVTEMKEQQLELHKREELYKSQMEELRMKEGLLKQKEEELRIKEDLLKEQSLQAPKKEQNEAIQKLFPFLSEKVMDQLTQYGISSCEDMNHLKQKDWEALDIPSFRISTIKQRLKEINDMKQALKSQFPFLDNISITTLIEAGIYKTEDMLFGYFPDFDKLKLSVSMKTQLVAFVKDFNDRATKLKTQFPFLLDHEIKALIERRINEPSDIHLIHNWNEYELSHVTKNKMMSSLSNFTQNRFFNDNVDIPDTINFNALISLTPEEIRIIEDAGLLSFKESIKMVFQLENHNIADTIIDTEIENGVKKHIHFASTLKLEESLAIYFYTIQWSQYSLPNLYQLLNSTLSSLTKREQKPNNFKTYLHFLMSALAKLPEWRFKTVYRGIHRNILQEYPEKYLKGKTIIWYSLTSTTTNKQVADDFIKDEGTLFVISEVLTGKSIQSLSMYEEGEVLIPPGAKFLITDIVSNQNRNIIHIKQVP